MYVIGARDCFECETHVHRCHVIVLYPGNEQMANAQGEIRVPKTIKPKLIASRDHGPFLLVVISHHSERLLIVYVCSCFSLSAVDGMALVIGTLLITSISPGYSPRAASVLS